MAITLIALPYDSGRFDGRMGRGPGALLASGLTEDLEGSGLEVVEREIRLPEGFITEGDALVQLQQRATTAACEAIARGSRPIFLSGNCGPAALSAIAAIGSDRSGVVWFDAHGDFNTPETSPSAFLDGMSLAVLVGDCFVALAKRFKGFAAIRPDCVVQIGVRDCDAEEEVRLERSGIHRVSAGNLAQLEPAVADLANRVSQLYVHVDVDVLDISVGRANGYACAGGLSVEELRVAIKTVAAAVPIRAASITAYDPQADESGAIGRAIPRIIESLSE
jgi:arginase